MKFHLLPPLAYKLTLRWTLCFQSNCGFSLFFGSRKHVAIWEKLGFVATVSRCLFSIRSVVKCYFRVILRRLVFCSRRFGTPYWFHIHWHEDGTNKEFRYVGYQVPEAGESPQKNSLQLLHFENLKQEKRRFLPFRVGHFPCASCLLLCRCKHCGLGRQQGLAGTLPFALRNYLWSHAFVSCFSFFSAVPLDHPSCSWFRYLFCIRITDSDITTAMLVLLF